MSIVLHSLRKKKVLEAANSIHPQVLLRPLSLFLSPLITAVSMTAAAAAAVCSCRVRNLYKRIPANEAQYLFTVRRLTLIHGKWRK